MVTTIIENNTPHNKNHTWPFHIRYTIIPREKIIHLQCTIYVHLAEYKNIIHIHIEKRTYTDTYSTYPYILLYTHTYTYREIGERYREEKMERKLIVIEKVKRELRKGYRDEREVERVTKREK